MKPKRKPTEAPPRDALSFEQAIQRLETIVGEMESAELPLEDLLKRYEEGTRLVRFCGQQLTEAEKKIALLAKKADGTVELKPFGAAGEDADTEAEAEAETEKEEKDEARLF